MRNLSYKKKKERWIGGILKKREEKIMMIRINNSKVKIRNWRD